MRTRLMQVLTSALCAGAVLTVGAAAADEAIETDDAPKFTVLEENARIPFIRNITGFEVVDEDRILLRVGVRQLYLAELRGTCGRDARFDHAIAVVPRGPGGVDRFSQLSIDGRRCGIESLARVERVEKEAAEAG